MKDSNDVHTQDLEALAVSDDARRTSTEAAQQIARLTRQQTQQLREIYDSAPRLYKGAILMLPVSMVAKEWGVTARRIRALLSTGQLLGLQHENGYWEVAYPYNVIEGRRGPPTRRRALKKLELRTV